MSFLGIDISGDSAEKAREKIEHSFLPHLFVFDCRQWTNDDLSSWSAACFDESTIIEERHRIGFFVVDTDSYKLYS